MSYSCTEWTGVKKVIEYINVSKTYSSGVVALSNINLKIKDGEFVFLVGYSGAGKTSLVKMLLKEIEPTKGRILINDLDITKLKNREIPYLRRKIGIVFQDFRLLPNRTIFENVAFAKEIIGASKEEIEKEVTATLNLVGLSDKANCYPNELSGGEQQRISIARAIVNNPEIIIADEPTGNLDPDTAWEIMTLLKEINKNGTTVIMVTHAKDIVDFMKRRVIALEGGKIVRDEERGVYGGDY